MVEFLQFLDVVPQILSAYPVVSTVSAFIGGQLISPVVKYNVENLLKGPKCSLRAFFRPDNTYQFVISNHGKEEVAVSLFFTTKDNKNRKAFGVTHPLVEPIILPVGVPKSLSSPLHPLERCEPITSIFVQSAIGSKRWYASNEDLEAINIALEPEIKWRQNRELWQVTCVDCAEEIPIWGAKSPLTQESKRAMNTLATLAGWDDGIEWVEGTTVAFGRCQPCSCPIELTV